MPNPTAESACTIYAMGACNYAISSRMISTCGKKVVKSCPALGGGRSIGHALRKRLAGASGGIRCDDRTAVTTDQFYGSVPPGTHDTFFAA